MTRECQNCKILFEITEDDSSFYERMKVPPPTFCPLCTMQRVMLWRNERSLYHRKDAFGKQVISIFAPEKSLTVYDQKAWWSDEWDVLSFGRDYDFSRPFFVQFRELLKTVPLPSVINKNAVNSDFCNHAEDSRNCYLIFGSIWNENVLYAKGAIKSKDSMDVFFGNKEELAYENIHCEETYNVSFSKNSNAARDSSFISDCHGAESCFLSVNLRNKKYHIFNVPYTKEEYQKKMKEFDLGSYGVQEKLRKVFKEFELKHPKRYAHVINSPGSTGDGLYDCKNCKACFDVTENAENLKFVANAGYSLKDSRMSYGLGLGELLYQSVDTGIGASNIFGGIMIRNGSNIRYSLACHGGSNLFGCVGIKNKNYCILNKQYSKDEYEKLVTRIIGHMNMMPYVSESGGREIIYKYGDFFPHEISPYDYNETVAQEYFPLTKEDARARGFLWREEEERRHQITLKPENLPDHIRDVDDSILDETIGCIHEGKCKEQCTSAFKIISQELAFYRKRNLALPRLCPNCRHYRRLAERASMILWTRECMCGGLESAIPLTDGVATSTGVGDSKSQNVYKNQTEHFHGSGHCPNKFETAYAPDRPDMLYCEQCYQAEVV